MTAPSQARALAEAVLRVVNRGVDRDDCIVGCGCLHCQSRALLAALDAPQPLDRETLTAGKIAVAWGELEMEAHDAWGKIQDATDGERPMSEYGDFVRLYCAHRILARLNEGRDSK